MGQRDVLVRCELAGILADEKALKYVFGYRGAAGSKPCPTCANLVQFVEDHLLVNIRFANLQTVDDRLLGYQSNEDVYNIVDQLHAAVGHVTVATFDRMQQISGINYLPDGMLADRYLRSIVKPIDHYLRAAMHTLTSGGVAGTEMSLLLQSLEAIGISPEHLQRWASAFSLPKAQGNPPATVFSSDRVGGTQMRCFCIGDPDFIADLACFLRGIRTGRCLAAKASSMLGVNGAHIVHLLYRTSSRRIADSDSSGIDHRASHNLSGIVYAGWGCEAKVAPYASFA